MRWIVRPLEGRCRRSRGKRDDGGNVDDRRDRQRDSDVIGATVRQHRGGHADAAAHASAAVVGGPELRALVMCFRTARHRAHRNVQRPRRWTLRPTRSAPRRVCGDALNAFPYCIRAGGIRDSRHCYMPTPNRVRQHEIIGAEPGRVDGRISTKLSTRIETTGVLPLGRYTKPNLNDRSSSESAR